MHDSNIHLMNLSETHHKTVILNTEISVILIQFVNCSANAFMKLRTTGVVRV